MKKFVIYSSFEVFLCLLFVQTTRADCNGDYGPSGTVECADVLNGAYDKRQWATCLSNIDIQKKTNGRSQCVDRTVTYCWYQCMIEKHGKVPGNHEPVYDDCACEETTTQTIQTPTPASILLPWCYSPSGEDCTWYRQCLEKRYPCEGTSYKYAITFAETYCERYTMSYTDFSTIGQEWINAVRKCLQKDLAQILNDQVNHSCQQIQEKAFQSHSVCYLSPDVGAPSVCDLPIYDWWNIQKNIRQAFSDAPFLKTLKSGGYIALHCIWDILKDTVKFILNIELENFNQRRMSTLEELEELAKAVADAIASKLDWWDSGIMWYAYSDSFGVTSTVSVELLITWKSTNNLNNNKVLNFNLTAVTQKVVKAVQDGELFFRNIGDKYGPIYVKQMKQCVDFECQRVKQDVTAPANKYKTSAFGRTNNIMHTILTLFICFIVIAFL